MFCLEKEIVFINILVDFIVKVLVKNIMINNLIFRFLILCF